MSLLCGRLPCETCTPRGWSVEPEVYCKNARSSRASIPPRVAAREVDAVDVDQAASREAVLVVEELLGGLCDVVIDQRKRGEQSPLVAPGVEHAPATRRKRRPPSRPHRARRTREVVEAPGKGRHALSLSARSLKGRRWRARVKLGEGEEARPLRRHAGRCRRGSPGRLSHGAVGRRPSTRSSVSAVGSVVVTIARSRASPRRWTVEGRPPSTRRVVPAIGFGVEGEDGR